MEQPNGLTLFLRYLRRNKGLAVGLLILLGLILFTVIGFMVINPKHAYPLSVATKKPPSWQYPFGTDFFGRNLLAAMVVGMWQTAVIGVIAGGLGTLIGVVLGFTSAYFGGWIDSTIRTVCQILTPIPVLLIQVVVAGSLDKRDVTIFTMALIVVMLAWMGPTLVIRGQVLTM
jgi:peptide/nickel transport system permease protein